MSSCEWRARFWADASVTTHTDQLAGQLYEASKSYGTALEMRTRYLTGREVGAGSVSANREKALSGVEGHAGTTARFDWGGRAAWRNPCRRVAAMTNRNAEGANPSSRKSGPHVDNGTTAGIKPGLSADFFN